MAKRNVKVVFGVDVDAVAGSLGVPGGWGSSVDAGPSHSGTEAIAPRLAYLSCPTCVQELQLVELRLNGKLVKEVH